LLYQIHLIFQILVHLRQQLELLAYGSQLKSDTIQLRSDSDFSVKFSFVQFYAIEHNSKSNRWIELKKRKKISKIN
jgi:hypothetical protein